ncbi:MAG: thioredoxin [Candidatus Saccharimonadales bacterium]|nr:thioredoxin [Candidatus Saccharimonadales bacterium]
MAKDVTAADFDKQVLDDEGVVLVDFWAAWCPPCRILGPIIEKVSENTKDIAKVLKLDVDSNQDIAMRYGIRGIPTVMIFKGGKVVETLVGVRPQEEYERLLDKHA